MTKETKEIQIGDLIEVLVNRGNGQVFTFRGELLKDDQFYIEINDVKEGIIRFYQKDIIQVKRLGDAL